MKRLFLLTCIALVALAPCMRAGIVVSGTLSREATIKPGEAFDGIIVLRNTGQKAAEARLFQTDYRSDAGGRTDYAEPGTTPRSNAPWITITPTRVKLAAGETLSVRYKGRAPADATLRGTYWSLILVEPMAEPAAADPNVGEKQVSVGLQTVIRFGVQIVTHIGREGTRSLQMLGKSLVKTDGKRELALDIGNNGERMLIPAVSVELFDPKGASVGRFDAGRTRIYPACSTRSKVDLSKVSAGKYTAMVLLDSGGDQVMGAQYDLAIEP